MKKLLNEIAWNVTEPEYRKDKSLSYSQLSTYERDGFAALFEKKQTTSLTFGSVVDTIITDGWDVFMEKYSVLPLKCSDTVLQIFIKIAHQCNCENICEIPVDLILKIAHEYNYGKSWKDETLLKKLNENNIDFQIILNQIRTNSNKIIISNTVFEEAQSTVKALLQSQDTKWYFNKDNDGIERYYQLKFKDTIQNVKYRCMADLIIVDHTNKTVTPCDLKTTGKPEYKFWESFHTWYYFYQAKLYWNLIRMTMDKDDYFKHFKLEPYKFIVVNKKCLKPTVYSFDEIEFKEYTYNNVTYRNILIVGEELQTQLQEREKQMNKDIAIQAIEQMHKSLDVLKEAFLDENQNNPPNDNKINLLELAKTIAHRYRTQHNKQAVEFLYKDIQYLANTDKKKGILPGWIKEVLHDKNNENSIEYKNVLKFSEYPVQDQHIYIQQAIEQYSDTIKHILKTKYEL